MRFSRLTLAVSINFSRSASNGALPIFVISEALTLLTLMPPPLQFALGGISGKTIGFRHDGTGRKSLEDGTMYFVRLEPGSRLCVSDYCCESFPQFRCRQPNGCLCGILLKQQGGHIVSLKPDFLLVNSGHGKGLCNGGTND